MCDKKSQIGQNHEIGQLSQSQPRFPEICQKCLKLHPQQSGIHHRHFLKAVTLNMKSLLLISSDDDGVHLTPVTPGVHHDDLTQEMPCWDKAETHN